MDHSTELEYVGFWLRLWAGIIDSILLMLVLIPLILAVYGWDYFASALHASRTADFLVSWVFPAVAVLIFWIARNATPGKMMISALIVDERTCGPPSMGQHIGRYLGYFLAVIPLGLGLLWVAIDPKKQGWHDKLAGTIVIRVRKRSDPIKFAG
jgi:uncharacterized RDD family membrane protein YckC